LSLSLKEVDIKVPVPINQVVRNTIKV
jgi:hypothetical protein